MKLLVEAARLAGARDLGQRAARAAQDHLAVVVVRVGVERDLTDDVDARVADDAHQAAG